MITWGAVGNSHDASLAVFSYNELVWAGLARDFSGIPNDPNLNQGILDYAIEHWGYPSYIIWYERPGLKTLRQWWAGQGWLAEENDIEDYFRLRGINCPTRIQYTQHHHSHAAYAYYTQPHDDCAVICLDSIGEFETLTIWHGKNGKLKKIHSQGYPHSLGLFYSAMTQRVGLVPQRDEYLISRWAEKGDSKRLMSTILEDLVHVHQESTKPHIRMRENLHRGCRWWRLDLNTEQDLFDIAAATQSVFEYCVKILSNYAHWKTNNGTAVAFAGGGALNKPAIDNLKSEWTNIWIPPNPGDPGSCIGAVLAKSKHFINIDRAWHKAV